MLSRGKIADKFPDGTKVKYCWPAPWDRVFVKDHGVSEKFSAFYQLHFSVS
jgi:hypothetical protein